MPEIKINDGDSFEEAVRSFVKQVERSGVLSERRTV